MSVIQAVLLGILGGLGIWDSRVMGMFMMDRPLFLGPVVGLILGDFQTGIVVGASLELVMMGIVGIGSATIPDTVSGSILATAFVITSGLDVSAAVALSLPIAKSEITWSVTKLLTVVFMLAGGTVVFTALFLIYAALCFFTLDGLEFMNIFTDGAREFGKYPVGVYGNGILIFATFCIPYALVQYYPLLYILGRRTEIFLMFLPILACWFIVPALLLWRFGVRHYKSSGS